MSDEFDCHALEAFLRHKVPGTGSSLKLERIAGGQSNPTYFVASGDRRMVLRKKPPGHLLPSAHAINREYRIMQALADTNVPVPRMILYADDPSIIGTPFFLMERIEGRVFASADIPGVDQDERRAMHLSAAETLARIHNVDWAGRGLSDFGKPGNYFSRQVSRWLRQWQSSKAVDIPEIERLGEWLSHNIPQDDRTTISHGDYRVGNLMFHETKPEVVAVLDWELSTLGHPLADLGFFCIAYHTSPSEYGGISGLDHDALGIPAINDLLGSYSKIMGEEQCLQPFHIVFGLFRFAIIFSGIQARVTEGNAADPSAAALGHLGGVFAGRGCQIVGI